jgi:hypothetical protein
MCIIAQNLQHIRLESDDLQSTALPRFLLL